MEAPAEQQGVGSKTPSEDLERQWKICAAVSWSRRGMARVPPFMRFYQASICSFNYDRTSG